ncbi:DUF3558 domain-containing protein [Nocardia sp. AG03]|uniref:DUF3558 domain-containing protein n=1 Tax=Nocardia sp. AG03 TaxID=3025312 RepID=UPI0024181CA7|nr:DUF3558 domain-containing protein [Nocardia sp. AG03]
MRKRFHTGATVLATVIGILAVVGCGTDSGEPIGPTVPTLTADGLEVDAPSRYDPCVGVTPEVLNQLQLVKAKNPNTADFDGPNGQKWRGCGWVRPNVYALSIRNTNLTLGFVKDNWGDGLSEFTIFGRSAISVRRSESDPQDSCYVNVELRGGSLEFHILKSASRNAPQDVDFCDIGKKVAESVLPTVPTDA